MPQFELQETNSSNRIERVRARSAEEAVRSWLSVSEDVDVALHKAESAMERLEGWQVILVGGVMKGRIRPHQRMRFRRD